jgi:hypothetical protein
VLSALTGRVLDMCGEPEYRLTWLVCLLSLCTALYRTVLNTLLTVRSVVLSALSGGVLDVCGEPEYTLTWLVCDRYHCAQHCSRQS